MALDVRDVPPASAAPDPEQELTVMTELAPILAQARAAHLAYRQASPHVVGGQTVADRPAALVALQTALERRERAEALDPDHSDPAWADDKAAKYDQAELLVFYRETLKRLTQ